MNGEAKRESTSEKLLGLQIDQNLGWKSHFYGTEEEPGLLKQLSSRLGMLKKLKKFLPNYRFKQLVSGLFYSKLNYGITVWGSIWSIPGNLDDNVRKRTMMTKEDLRRLQVLQNSIMRVETSGSYDEPVASLLAKTKQLSIHQKIAYYTLNQVYNISKYKAPAYHHRRLFGGGAALGINTRSTRNFESRVEFDISLARGSFFYQASRLWSSIPLQMKQARTLQIFKKMARKWTEENILMRQ